MTAPLQALADVIPVEVPFCVSQKEARVIELAKLKALEYDLVREAEAKAMGVRIATLDKEVSARRPRNRENADDDDGAAIEVIEPWGKPVDGESLAEEIRHCLRSYVIFGAIGDPDAATLWVLGSYLMDVWRLWPRLMITSPTKQCGKSTLLEVLEAVSHGGLILSNAKSAGVFRAIEAWHPTLLLDEADTWMKDDQELAGILNSGHTVRTARVIRVQEQNGAYVPTLFSTWCPMVIAGIGTQRDTLMSRSVIISLRRKLPAEHVERLPTDLFERMARVRKQVKRWAADNSITLSALDTEPTECGNDRRRDNFTPLHRIAQVLGGAWPDRLAAVYAAQAANDDDSHEPAGIMMLRDLHQVFADRRADKLPSADLVIDLCNLEERPWNEWRHGKPLTSQTIAKLMKPFEVRPRDAKISGQVLKSYHRADINAAFARYTSKPATNPPPRYHVENIEENNRATRYPNTEGNGPDTEITLINQSGSGVAAKVAGLEGIGHEGRF